MRATLLALAVMILVASGVTAAQASPVVADDGAKVVEESWLDARTVDLKIDSPALGTTGKVRLLVPSGWAAQPTRTWPVLFLLHGCCEPVDYKSWAQYPDVKAIPAPKAALVM